MFSQLSDLKFNDSKCKSISGMKYCSKHISHGNSMKCKNSSSRHRGIHWIKRPEVVLKFLTTHSVGGRPGPACPWVQELALNLLHISTSSLGKVRLSASKTLWVFCGFSSLSGDDLSKCISKVRLKKTICDGRCMNIWTGFQIKTERNPYNNVHVKKMDLSCTLQGSAISDVVVCREPEN